MTGATWKNIISNLLETMDNVTEVETNGTTSLFYKQYGKRKEVINVYEDEDDYVSKMEELINLVKSEEEKQINPDSKFLVEGRLKLTTGETARVHIVMPPAADTPQVTIAKKSNSLSTLEEIQAKGSMSSVMLDYIKAAIDCNMTIILSGGTGAGKTTMLEAMTKLIDPEQRIAVVEDLPELRLIQPNVTYTHSTLWTPGKDKNAIATLSWCVAQVNRARTDKVIIGETRGGEFADFITAANSGMEGSLTTIHANNPRAALQKMTQFMIIGQPQPVRLANEAIASSVDLIIQLGFNDRGENRVLEIVEVSRTIGTNEAASIATQPVFKYNKQLDNWDENGYISEDIRRLLEKNNYDIKTFRKKSGMEHDKIKNLMDSSRFGRR